MSTPIASDVLDELSHIKETSIHSKNQKNDREFEIKPIWTVIIVLSYLHLASLYGLYLVFTSAKLSTTLFAFSLYQFTMTGVTAGAHRLWSHRSYKAKWPLRLMLLIMFSTAYQYSVIRWAREHRLHHKYTDTNADPYNAKRGAFFSHIGWISCQRHPEVFEKGHKIDVSDLYADPMLKFQHEHIGLVSATLALILPTIIPMYFWQESLKNAFYLAVALRWTFTFNVTALVNSVAHMYGNKPYDINMSAGENYVTSLLTLGEAWHNYHHAFPWDYKASELGKYSSNPTTAFLDLMARFGLAYDLKTISTDLVKHRVRRTGDGTHAIWGWNDKDMPEEERKAAVIIASK